MQYIFNTSYLHTDESTRKMKFHTVYIINNSTPMITLNKKHVKN